MRRAWGIHLNSVRYMPEERSQILQNGQKARRRVLTLPGAHVETPICDRDDNRRSHKRCFRMRNSYNK